MCSGVTFLVEKSSQVARDGERKGLRRVKLIKTAMTWELKHCYRGMWM